MQTLVFVYNGDSGLVNSLMHLMHKTISPETYECQLCAIVYDGARQSKDWKNFINDLNIQAEYFHRDTFIKAYGNLNADLPAVFLKTPNESLELVISASDFQSLKTMEQLQQKIKQILAQATSAT
ncbi:hypothetical protein [Acinetobacter sp. ESBL14]|uniref:hypothetical protein n=1 Tax=Acinetobacter sp. ESBL14 TaxID=3077329 RepID=UPI002FC7D63D